MNLKRPGVKIVPSKNHKALILIFYYFIYIFRIAAHVVNFATRYTKIKFAILDIDYVGQQNLDRLDLDLKLGAIPSFYLYRDGYLCDMLISSSHIKLETFIETNYIKDPASIDDETNQSNTLKNVEKLKVIKCSNCFQYGHKTNECKLPDKNAKIVKIISNEKPNSTIETRSNGRIQNSFEIKKHISIVANYQKKSQKPINLIKSSSSSNFNNNKNKFSQYAQSTKSTTEFNSDNNNNNNNNNSNNISNNKNNNRSTVNLSIINTDLQKNKSKPITRKESRVSFDEPKEIKEPKLNGEQTSDLLDKISKLEGVNQKQKEEISRLKEIVEQLTSENRLLKSNKSITYY